LASSRNFWRSWKYIFMRLTIFRVVTWCKMVQI
jgi:hypothetical protein